MVKSKNSSKDYFKNVTIFVFRRSKEQIDIRKNCPKGARKGKLDNKRTFCKI